MSTRQPPTAAGEVTDGDGSARHASAMLPPDRSDVTWLTVDNGTTLPARRSSSLDAAPVKLSILMAAYNEQKTIVRVIDEILHAKFPCEIELLVVDDGSTDNTPLLLSEVEDPRVRVHRHPSNEGKGAAILTAASMATGTHILPFDADLEYEPEDIPRVLDPLLRGRCNVVYGARLFGCNTVYQSYLYAVGNRMLTRMANILFNAPMTDLHTCLKLMPLVLFRKLNLREKGFGLDSEITAQLLRQGIRPFEVPVSYYGRSHAEGKKIRWRDAVACAWILFRMRVRKAPRREPASSRREEGERTCIALAGAHETVASYSSGGGP